MSNSFLACNIEGRVVKGKLYSKWPISNYLSVSIPLGIGIASHIISILSCSYSASQSTKMTWMSVHTAWVMTVNVWGTATGKIHCGHRRWGVMLSLVHILGLHLFVVFIPHLFHDQVVEVVQTNPFSPAKGRDATRAHRLHRRRRFTLTFRSSVLYLQIVYDYVGLNFR